MEFEAILKLHQARYPEMTPQDYAKLAYQSEFGPEHLVTDEAALLCRLREEWGTVGERAPRFLEDIGGGLCRFYLHDISDKNTASEVLVKLFHLTAKNHTGSRAGLEEKLAELEKLPVFGIREWLAEYRERGCPALRHSETYRTAYAPHYRLLKWEYARFFPALLEVSKLLKLDKPCVIAIDGRCGSGKSTLAALMAQIFDCNVFHMDDFYLPKEKRAENWLDIPGGNMDLMRFRREVLNPAFAGEAVLYRPYDCGRGAVGEGERFAPKKLTIVEGSYSHHPDLQADYDLKLFLTCDKEEQIRRLKIREGDYYPTFARVWMPLEEQYISKFRVGDHGSTVLNTGI